MLGSHMIDKCCSISTDGRATLLFLVVCIAWQIHFVMYNTWFQLIFLSLFAICGIRLLLYHEPDFDSGCFLYSQSAFPYVSSAFLFCFSSRIPFCSFVYPRPPRTHVCVRSCSLIWSSQILRKQESFLFWSHANERHICEKSWKFLHVLVSADNHFFVWSMRTKMSFFFREFFLRCVLWDGKVVEEIRNPVTSQLIRND